MRRILFVMALLGLAVMPVSAQVQVEERRGMNMPPGENVIGKVTSVSKDTITVTPLTGGDPVTVKISGSTRVMKERQPVKLEDIKADETVFARGELKNNVMQAGMVSVVNPEMMQRFQPMGGGGAGRMAGYNPEDLGKKFIVGEVKAINETKLTIARPDGQSQDVEVDENTSFKRGQESITLPDIKVGDFVRGRGEVQNGMFVPKELIVGRPQQQMRILMGGPGGASPEQKKPESASPAPVPPK